MNYPHIIIPYLKTMDIFFQGGFDRGSARYLEGLIKIFYTITAIWIIKVISVFLRNLQILF